MGSKSTPLFIRIIVYIYTLLSYHLNAVNWGDFFVRQNVTLPVLYANFQYNKTCFIPGSYPLKKSPLLTVSGLAWSWYPQSFLKLNFVQMGVCKTGFPMKPWVQGYNSLGVCWEDPSFHESFKPDRSRDKGLHQRVLL